MAGGNENDSKDMGGIVMGADAIRNATGAHVMLVHHCGKKVENGMRGHSLLLGNIDTEITIEQKNDTRVVSLTKQKEGELGHVCDFALTTVPLKILNKRNKEMASAVAIPQVISDFEKLDNGLNPRQRAGYDILCRLLEGSEEISKDALKEELKKASWPPPDKSRTEKLTADSFRTACDRLIKDLVEHKLIQRGKDKATIRRTSPDIDSDILS